MSKRAVDIALAALLLAASFPLLIVAIVLIKWDSAGPAIFRQMRMGRGFRQFPLLKLRTMRLCNHGLKYTLGADPRITGVGRWLRWLKIDELPQLWNVLRGEMSLVGPRPVIPELALEFRSHYEQLLLVRPGLTDPATLKYCRETQLLASVTEPLGYFKTVVTPDKIRISEAYMKRANGWTDLGVLLRTVSALLALLWQKPVVRSVRHASAPAFVPVYRLASARRRGAAFRSSLTAAGLIEFDDAIGESRGLLPGSRSS